MPTNLLTYALLEQKCFKAGAKLVLPLSMSPFNMMAVGESLGKEEEEQELYFIGSSGKLLDKLFREVGLIRENIHITNVVKVRIPAKVNKEQYLNSIHLSIQDFIPYLKEEIERVKPSIILAIGDIAMQALTGETKITKRRGSVLECKLSSTPIKVIPTLHPAYLKSYGQMGLYPYVRADIQLFARLRYGLQAQQHPFEALTDPSFTETIDYLHEINTSSTSTSIDIETVARQRITCIGFTKNPNDAICIPFRHNGLKNRWSKAEQLMILAVIKEIWNNPNITKIGQFFLYYDIHWLLSLLGFPREPLFDIAYAHMLIHPDARHDLGFTTSVYTDMPYHKDDFKDWESKDLPHDEALWGYNIRDVIAPHRIYTKLKKDLIELGLYEFFVGYVMPFRRVLFDMECDGLRVDMQAREKWTKFVEQKGLPVLLNAIKREVGKFINPNSSKQVGAVLETQYHLPIPKTKLGNYTVKEDIIEDLIARFPQHKRVLKLILRARVMKAKDLGTYLTAPLSADGRLRTSYGYDVTGRLSSKSNHIDEGTNLQNQPKRFRRLYLPDEGHTFLEPDLEQAEAFVLVYQMQAEQLKARMNKGEKIHAVVTEWIHSKKISELTSTQYRDVKSTVYGCVDDKTQVLTLNGWISINELHTVIPIAVWNASTRAITFEAPTDVVQYTHSFKHAMVQLKQGYFDQLVTLDHRMPHVQVRYGRKRKHVNGPVRDVLAKAFKKTNNAYKLPLSGKNIGNVTAPLRPLLNTAITQLLVATQADLTVRETGALEGNFTKQRKIIRLHTLLHKLNMCYTTYPYGATGRSFYINPCNITDTLQSLLHHRREYGWWVLQLPHDILKVLLEELPLWDGRANGPDSWQYYTTSKMSAEVITTAAHLANMRGIIARRENTFKGKPTKDLYTVSISRFPLGDLTSMRVRHVTHTGQVLCPCTTTGYFLTKRNERISVTGNSNYGMGIRKYAASIGKTVAEARELQAKYFTVVPQLPTYHKWVADELEQKRNITTFYGRTRICTGDIDDSVLRSFYAQIPQSTVADTINLGILGLWLIKPDDIKLKVQVHDSILISLSPLRVGWFTPYIKAHLETLREVTINNDLLVIPVDIGETKENWYGK